MAISEGELSAKRLRADLLRSEISSIRTRVVEKRAEEEREATSVALDGEIERLERELMAAGAASGSTESALQAMDRAAAIAEQAKADAQEAEERKAERAEAAVPAHELLVEPRVIDEAAVDQGDEEFEDDDEVDDEPVINNKAEDVAPFVVPPAPGEERDSLNTDDLNGGRK